jgi:putative ABC transport system permease protein
MSSSLATPALVARHVRSGIAGSILVAVLVGLTVLVVSLAPRALVQLSAEQLHHTLGELAPEQRDLTATGVFGYRVLGAPSTATEMFGSTAARLDSVPSEFSKPLAPLVAGSDWVIRTAGHRADPVGVESPIAHPMLALAVDLEWSSRITFVEGAAPVAWDGDEKAAVEQPAQAPIEIALSARSAEQLGLAVGDILEYSPLQLMVAGIYKPLDPESDYWLHASDLAVGDPRHGSDGGVLIYATAYIDPGTAVGLLDRMAVAEVSAWYPIGVEQLEFADAAEARDQARAVIALGGSLPSGQPMAYASGFPNAIDAVIGRIGLVTSLLALAVSGPLGVVLAVFALGVQSVLDRRRSALALVSARGGGGTQLRLLMVIEGLIIALPAAALAILAAALLIPVAVGPEAYALPVILALSLPALFAIAASPGSLRPTRTDIAIRSRGGTRWVIELAVLGLAALALYLLFRRGLAEGSSLVAVDPLLVATPFLLSLAVCVIVLRIYPALMLAVQRWTRTRGSAVWLVGAARAVRAPALGFAATLALVVGISIAVFSTALSTTVSAALGANAGGATGSDFRVLAPAIDEKAVAAVNGVAATAGLERIGNVPLSAGRDEQTVIVVLANFDELAKVRPDLGLPTDTSGVAYLASADLNEFLSAERDSSDTIDGTDVRLAGMLPATALPIEHGSWILIDAADAGAIGLEFTPKEVLVSADGSASHTQLATAISSAVRDALPANQRDAVRVIDAAQLLSVASIEPVVMGLNIALLLAALLTALLSVLAIVLASLSSAPVRNRLIGVLRILGMSPRQLRGLIRWEFAPVAITAIVAGTLLGLGEIWLVTAAIDLRPFLQGTVPASPSIDIPLIAAVVIGFAVVVSLAGVVTTAIGRRLSPASSVKIGIE